ncbi:MAG: lipoate--protein ligase family protein [candidate division KSB1 bacterium]|nr:lipoate--protein ligase family protein [candidate division KSB1 bacterium]
MARERWRLLVTRNLRGSHNMAIDHILAAQSQEHSPPVLRLYDWSPPAVSLGYHQNATEVDLDRTRDFGVDVVRRPTGGRAVLHANELTYSVVLPAGSPYFSRRPEDIYFLLSRCFLRALRLFGIAVQPAGPERRERPPSRSLAGAACFAASARHELKVNGRKILGSAQRRYPCAVLQHGSLLIGPEHLLLADLLRKEPEERQRLRAILSQRTTSLREETGRPLSFPDVAEVVTRAFSEELQIELQPDELVPSEVQAAEAAEHLFKVGGGRVNAEEQAARPDPARRDGLRAWAGFPLLHLQTPRD